MFKGEVASLLVMEMFAVAEFVAAVGAKLTVKLLFAPGAIWSGAVTEPSENPAPVNVIAETSSSALPALETCMV